MSHEVLPGAAMFKNNIKIFSGDAHRSLAENVALRLGTTLEKCKIGHFLNHETMCVVLLAYAVAP